MSVDYSILGTFFSLHLTASEILIKLVMQINLD